jgi:benzoyl-CoA reductase/2-hydroxyglutaryl-CoA dehydratase subunit BcrC/BadD/HgdB
VTGSDRVEAQHPYRIGVVGADLPRQIVRAAGAVPVRIFGSWTGEVSARAIELTGAVDAVAGRILDALLAGDHDDLDALVICNDSQANLRMFYVLRVLSARGEVPFPVQLLDTPRGAGAPREAFVATQYARLAEFCSRVTGTAIGIEELRSAGAAEQRVGAALGRLRERRADGRCTGTAALGAYRAANVSEPDAAVAVIDASQSATAEGKRIFLTGSAHPDPLVYDALERDGFVIAGEDHDTGDAGWFAASTSGETVADVFVALAAAHAERAPSAAKSTTAERVPALMQRVTDTRSGAVLALVRDLDDAPTWELASFRAALSAEHVPFVSRVRIAADEAILAARDAAAVLAVKEGARR